MCLRVVVMHDVCESCRLSRSESFVQIYVFSGKAGKVQHFKRSSDSLRPRDLRNKIS